MKIAKLIAAAVLLIAVLLGPLGMIAAQDEGEWPEMRATFIPLLQDEVVEIDGALEEEIWSRVPIISDFHQIRPDDHGVPSEKTEVQITRTDEFVYVAFRAHDSDISNLSAKGLIQGQNFFSDDRLAIYIDTFDDRRNSYFFRSMPTQFVETR